MAKIADPTAQPTLAEDDRSDEETSGRVTARTLAAALALLAIAVLVATRSQAAFHAEAASTEVAVSVGDVSLTDDDRGGSLFSIPTLAPNDPAERCIVVEYEGTLLPTDVLLDATADGSLARGLSTVVDVGEGGSFGQCDDFEAHETIYDGTLRGLADAGRLRTYTAHESPTVRTFRFTFVLDEAANREGAEATASFEWIADTR